MRGFRSEGFGAGAASKPGFEHQAATLVLPANGIKIMSISSITAPLLGGPRLYGGSTPILYGMYPISSVTDVSRTV